jgi:hypothetical protein
VVEVSALVPHASVRPPTGWSVLQPFSLAWHLLTCFLLLLQRMQTVPKADRKVYTYKGMYSAPHHVAKNCIPPPHPPPIPPHKYTYTSRLYLRLSEGVHATGCASPLTWLLALTSHHRPPTTPIPSTPSYMSHRQIAPAADHEKRLGMTAVLQQLSRPGTILGLLLQSNCETCTKELGYCMCCRFHA